MRKCLRVKFYEWYSAGDLWISWEEGMKVFDELLLDADWSVNAGQWMWLSGWTFRTILKFKILTMNFVRRILIFSTNFPLLLPGTIWTQSWSEWWLYTEISALSKSSPAANLITISQRKFKFQTNFADISIALHSRAMECPRRCTTCC